MEYSFKDDYSEGWHPKILEALLKTNMVQQSGYGEDEYSKEAKVLIKGKINNQNSDIHLISGWTQANLVVISSILRPYEAVICAETGHINVHEAGAIESTWHKVCITPSTNWKLTPQDIQAVLDTHWNDYHMVKPKLVYISNSTEIGTIYKKEELWALSDFCRTYNLFLYMDWARIGSALCAEDNDLTLSDVSQLTDIFYIWWTKNWALLWEAIVINNNELKWDFLYQLKQRWALLAKWRLLWVQFIELFKSDLFFLLAYHGNSMAMKLARAIKEKWYTFLTDSTTNQIFPVLPNNVIENLSADFAFYKWKNIDKNQSAIRLVTSWATPEVAVNKFIEALNTIE